MVTPVFGSTGPVVAKGIDLDEVFSGTTRHSPVCGMREGTTQSVVEICSCTRAKKRLGLALLTSTH